MKELTFSTGILTILPKRVKERQKTFKNLKKLLKNIAAKKIRKEIPVPKNKFRKN